MFTQERGTLSRVHDPRLSPLTDWTFTQEWSSMWRIPCIHPKHSHGSLVLQGCQEMDDIQHLVPTGGGGSLRKGQVNPSQNGHPSQKLSKIREAWLLLLYVLIQMWNMLYPQCCSRYFLLHSTDWQKSLWTCRTGLLFLSLFRWFKLLNQLP